MATAGPPSALAPGEVVEARTERMVAGGRALGRLSDGRRALVEGALPGERIAAEVTRVQPGVVHATTVDVLDAADARVEPPCPLVAAGCGGCDWQHIDIRAQHRFKRDIALDALRHITGIEEQTVEAAVDETVALSSRDHRSTVRGVATSEGNVGLRKRRSHDLVAISGCMVAHPQLRALIDEVSFAPGTEVSLRIGPGTGARLGSGTGARPDALPDDVTWVDTTRARARARTRDATYDARIAGAHLAIPATSFFQPHVDAPAALVELVTAMVTGPEGARPERLADLYAGVGLFAATVPAASVVAVERDRSSARAAARNVAGRVIHAPVERADIGEADAVIADPSRAGLAKAGTAAIARTGAQIVALVSCDPASFARDAKLLDALGYTLERAVPVDQFGHTSHIEIVGRFTLR